LYSWNFAASLCGARERAIVRAFDWRTIGMTTRSEAVQYLSARGFHAEERDWAAGQTVLAASEPSKHQGVTVYRRAVYIVPKGNNWTCMELGRSQPNDEDELSLDAACERVASILTAA
jgi:hypothetical protein